MRAPDTTTLWMMRLGPDHVSCVGRILPHGVEVEIVFNNAPLMSRVFDTGDAAFEWAEAKREDWRTRA